LTGVEKNKQDQEIRRQKKHRELLTAINTHQRIFKEYYSQNLQKVKKVNRGIGQYHVSKQRKEQQQKERAEKDRMKALKVLFNTNT
jgi:hypothetical protein